MSTVDIDELHHDTTAILRRVRDHSETIAISENGEVVAQLSPVDPERSSRQPAGHLEPANPEVEHAAIWAELTRLGEELARTWPDGLSAVDAIREHRSRSDDVPTATQVVTISEHAERDETDQVLDRLWALGDEISKSWPKGVSAIDAIRDVRRDS